MKNSPTLPRVLIALSIVVALGLLVTGICLCPKYLLLGFGVIPMLGTVFPGNCSGRVVTVSASNGCTLTRADIRALTPEAFAALDMTEIGMQEYYAKAQEARLAGYRENTLMELLMSKITNIKGELTKSSVRGSGSVIAPFISRRQKRNINSNYWKIVSGTPNPNANTADIPAGAWDVVVDNSPSALATTLTNLSQYFLPGKVMFIEYANASTNVAYSLQYKILASRAVASTTVVTITPNYSDAGWAALAAGSKLPYQIGGAAGGNADAGTIAYLGVNSVSDYESWGGQDPAENPQSLLNYFLQTSRIVHEYSDEYLKALNARLMNNYFTGFAQLPLAEQKRIQRAKYDRDFLNSAFYGQRINELQTVEGYRSLPQVVDPARPDCVLEYKSNALGFRTQLSDCSRILDHQGNPLNFDTLMATLYLVKRAREADGGTVETIDCMTDRFTAGMIQDVMIDYYNKKYKVNTTRFYEPNQALKFENQVMLKYNRYQLPPELGGFDLAVFTHPFFDDKLLASGSSNRGRALWFLDWSDIELGVAGTNSAVRRTNEADELYNYVIKINAKHVTLDSMTWTPIIEDPNRHYIVENFSSACPVLTVAACEAASET